MFAIVDKNEDGFISLSEFKEITLAMFGNALTFFQRARITEDNLKYQLKYGLGEDFLGLDNQLNLDEYQRYIVKSANQCFYD